MKLRTKFAILQWSLIAACIVWMFAASLATGLVGLVVVIVGQAVVAACNRFDEMMHEQAVSELDE